MKTLLMSTVAALFVAGAAFAADETDVVVVIDGDVDGVITAEEWGAFRSENDDLFGDWDADDDDFLSRDEYEARLEMQDDADGFGAWEDYYVGWDADGDGMLSIDEYNTGVWTMYDADADGMWSMDEARGWQTDEMNYDAVRRGSQISQ